MGSDPLTTAPLLVVDKEYVVIEKLSPYPEVVAQTAGAQHTVGLCGNQVADIASIWPMRNREFGDHRPDVGTSIFLFVFIRESANQSRVGGTLARVEKVIVGAVDRAIFSPERPARR